MLKILEETHDNILALHVSEHIDDQDIDKVTVLMDKMLQDYESPDMYVEIYNFDTPSAKTIWKDMKNTPKYNKLGKCAIVAEMPWLELVTKLSASVMRPEMKHFNHDQKAEAMQWLERKI
jgi:ribosome-binding factor A